MKNIQKISARDIEIIEHIVSGELTDQECNQQLKRFQTEPSPLDYWRALALAFIEKQALKKAFLDIANLPDISETNEHLVPPSKLAIKRHWFIPLACSALIVIAITFISQNNQVTEVNPGDLSSTSAEAVTPSSPTPTSSPLESNQTAPPVTAYVATYLENGDQLVVPINYYTSSN